MWWPWDFLFKRDDDPLRDLDPSLRDFITKERPHEYKASAAALPDDASRRGAAPSYAAQVGLAEPESSGAVSAQLAAAQARGAQAQAQAQAHTATTTSSSDADADAPARPLPSASLYPDGRYAHLWRTYRPQAEVDEAGKTDQDKLHDILQGYRERQAQVGRAALENCAELQFAVHECFRTGSWSARLSMCRAENRALNRCLALQARFLRALGYASVVLRDDEDEERIQMHADRLYRRMLRQEDLVAEARARGEQPPDFPPLIRREHPAPAPGQGGASGAGGAGKGEDEGAETVFAPLPRKNTWDGLSDEARRKFAESRFEGLEGVNLELAKRELEQEIEDYESIYWRLEQRYRADYRERKRREALGYERATDKVKKYLDFRNPPPETDDDIPEDRRA